MCALTKEVGVEGSMLMEQQLQDFAWGSVQRDHCEHQVPLSLVGIDNGSRDQAAHGELGVKKYLRWWQMS